MFIFVSVFIDWRSQLITVHGRETQLNRDIGDKWETSILQWATTRMFTLESD